MYPSGICPIHIIEARNSPMSLEKSVKLCKCCAIRSPEMLKSQRCSWRKPRPNISDNLHAALLHAYPNRLSDNPFVSRSIKARAQLDNCTIAKETNDNTLFRMPVGPLAVLGASEWGVLVGPFLVPDFIITSQSLITTLSVVGIQWRTSWEYEHLLALNAKAIEHPTLISLPAVMNAWMLEKEVWIHADASTTARLACS